MLTKKTVKGILSGFSKMVDQLHGVAQEQEAEVAKQDAIVDKALVAREAARVEREAALAAAAKISDLIG